MYYLFSKVKGLPGEVHYLLGKVKGLVVVPLGPLGPQMTKSFTRPLGRPQGGSFGSSAPPPGTPKCAGEAPSPKMI